MTAKDMCEQTNGRERRGAGGPTPGTGSPVEDAAIDDLALMLYHAAALTGERPEDLLAGMSDVDLSALYLGCAEKICGARGPLADCPALVNTTGVAR